MNLFKAAGTVSAFTFLSRITGLLREWIVATQFGASAWTDAFNVAFRIPNLFRRLFAEGAFSQAFVPVLAATRAEHGDERTKEAIDHIATVLAWALLIFSILGVLAAPWLVWAMASGLRQGPGFDAAVTMTRWMFPYIGFMSLVALSAGILNTWKRFVVPAATPVLLNVSVVLVAWFLSDWMAAQTGQAIYALPLGVMVGGFLQLAFQIPALKKLGLLPRIGLGWTRIKAATQDSATRRILTLMGPALLGVGVAQISLLINTQIASHMRAGSVSWLTYADRLMEFPTAMLGVALGVVLMPQLAAAKAQGQDERYAALLDWGLRWVCLLAMPAAVALIVFGQALVAVMYHYGAFTAADVLHTQWALAAYGVGLLGLVGIKVLAPGYFAKQDTKTPVRIAVVMLILTQLLNLVFVPWFAHAGLALSIGVAALINALVLLIGLVRSGSYRASPGWLRFALQIGAATTAMGLWLWWVAGHFNWLDGSQAGLRLLVLLGTVLSAALLYFGVMQVLGFRIRAFVRRQV